MNTRRPCVHRWIIEDLEGTDRLVYLAPKKDVRRCREIVAQGKVLIDDLDPLHPGVNGLMKCCGTPSMRISPPMEEVARDDLDECRLAGAVIAHQANGLTGLDRKIDTLKGLDRAEMLGDALEFQQRHASSRVERAEASLARSGLPSAAPS